MLQAAGAPLASDRDSEVDPADPKMAAMAELRRRHRITKGKKKVDGLESWKRKVHSASRVEESEDEAGGASAGPSTPKRLKTEPAPQAEDKVFSGNGKQLCWSSILLVDFDISLAHCGKCRADKATCFIHGGLRTCQQCHVKKARCSFNKGSDDGGAAESTTVMELLQDISSRLAHLEDKVECVLEHMEDLMDDYHPDHNVKYPNDLPSKSMMAEFEASRLELRKTGDIYSKVLHKMATQHLDRDMAIIKAKGLQSLAMDMPLEMEDPYEILNKSFWVGTVRVSGLHEQMLACNKFLQAHQNFYNAHRCQKEWQLWKRLLKGQEGYRVEDSNEPLDLEEEVRKDMVPGVDSVGIPELDALIKMPMPDEDPEEEAEKELRQQATAHMRVYRQSRGEEVESEVEMYEDLEPLLVQEVELEGDIVIAGPSRAEAS